MANGDIIVAGYFVKRDDEESELRDVVGEVPGTRLVIPAKEATDPEWVNHKLGYLIEQARVAVMKFGRTGQSGVRVETKV